MAKARYEWLRFKGDVDWKHVNPYLLRQLNALARDRRQIIIVTSGYRTYAEQVKLYERYKNSGFNIRYIAAKPGQSNHEGGLAVDATIGGVPVGKALSAKVLAKYGLGAPVKGDPVHIEMIGAVAKAAKGTAAPSSAAAAPAQTTGPTEGAAALPSYEGQLPTEQGLREPVNLPPGSVQAEGFSPRQIAETWQLIARQPNASPETLSYASILN